MAPDPAADTRADASRNTAALDAVAEFLRLVAAAGLAPAANGRESEAAPPRSVEIVRLVSQVILACTASSLRYWGRSAEIWGRTMPLIVDTLAGAGGRPQDDAEAMSRRVDEIRAALREFAEMPGQESKRLQAELEQIVLGRAAGVAAERHPDAPDRYWRRWETKP